MRGPSQYQRQFILQVHCGINAFCFIVTLICILALRFSIGLIELFALILPIIGVLSLFMNSNLGKGRKVMKECYLFGSLASILSLFLVSQVLIQFCYKSWLWGVGYFLFTGAALVAIVYLFFFGDMHFLYKCLTPVTLIAALIIGILVSIVIYRFFLSWCFTAGFVLFLSYLLWIIDLIMTVFICLDLRIILFKGR